MNKEDITRALEYLNDNYRLIALRDSCNYDSILGTLYLNNKHSIQDFQSAIYKAKGKREKEITEYGDDWTYISEELGDFDYIEYDNNDFIEDSVEY